MKELNALYYPEIACLDERFLKYLLLIYDKIYFLPNDTRLNPGYDTISTRFSINDPMLNMAFGTFQEVESYTMYSCEEPSWDTEMKSTMATYDYLEDKGICLPVVDEDFSDPLDKYLLEDPVRSDLNDINFMGYCKRNFNTKMKLPDPNKYGEIKGGGFVIPSIKRGISPIVYFSFLCSERINNALYLAGKYNLIPISKNSFFQDTLILKLNRITNNPEFFKEEHIDIHKHNVNTDILSWEVTNQVVPVEVLMNKSVDQILKYKDEASESQEQFRSYIEEIGNLIAEEPWTENIRNEIEKKVRLEIIPNLEKVQESKRALWNKLFGDAIDTASTHFVTPALSLGLISGLNYIDILIYSTIIWTGNLLPKLRDFSQKRKEISKHSMYYLMNF